MVFCWEKVPTSRVDGASNPAQGPDLESCLVTRREGLVLNCEILFTDHVSDYLKIEEKQPPSLSIESFKEFSTGHLVQYDDIVSGRNLFVYYP